MNRHPARFAAAAALWLGAAALSGCGASPAARDAEPPRSAAAAAPGTHQPVDTSSHPGELEGALAELERAEDELELAIGAPAEGRASPTATEAAPSPAAPPAPEPPAAAPRAPERSDSTTAQSPRPKSAGGERPAKRAEPASPCESACRALASMSRAAQHLCGLTGDADERCGDARTRVTRATDRVEAVCPRCAAL